MKNNKKHPLTGLFLSLVFLFSFWNQILAQKNVHYKTFIRDTFDVYENRIQQDSLTDYLSIRFFENTDGSYSHLKYRDFYNAYLIKYDSKLKLVDSTRMQRYGDSNTITMGNERFFKIPSGKVISSVKGIYGYNNSNKIIWSVEPSNGWIESVVELKNYQYLISLSQGNGTGDSLFKVVYIIDQNGNIKFNERFFIMINSGIYQYYADDNVALKDDHVYITVADSNDLISYQKGPWISSTLLIKMDLSGKIIWQRHIPISAGRFSQTSQGLFLFGNNNDSNQNWHLYKVDTANGNIKTYFKYPDVNLRPYNDSLWIYVKDAMYIGGNKNKLNVNINIFKINDTTDAKSYYHFNYYRSLEDSLTTASGSYDFELDTKNNILLKLRISRDDGTFWQPLGSLLLKFALRIDTTTLVDSLWGVHKKYFATNKEMTILWSTLMRRNSFVTTWSKIDPTQKHVYDSQFVRVTSHNVIFNVSDTGWHYYYIWSIGIWGDTLSSEIDSFYIKEILGGLSSLQQDFIFHVYPNPSNGKFVLETNVSGAIIFYSMEGKLIFSEQIQTGTTEIDLIHLNLSAGLYTYQFKQNNQIITGKIIIQ